MRGSESKVPHKYVFGAQEQSDAKRREDADQSSQECEVVIEPSVH